IDRILRRRRRMDLPDPGRGLSREAARPRRAGIPRVGGAGRVAALYDELRGPLTQIEPAQDGPVVRGKQYAALRNGPEQRLLSAAWRGGRAARRWDDQSSSSLAGSIRPQASAGAMSPDTLPGLERIHLLLLGAIPHRLN